MSSDHPAAKHTSVNITDFRNIGWMMFPKRAAPAIYEKLMEASRNSNVAPVELHHYVVPQEVVQLIAENFGAAFMPKGIALQLEGPGLAARPFEDKNLQVKSQMLLRADQSSRLINEFGRAFLKRYNPDAQESTPISQLNLKLGVFQQPQITYFGSHTRGGIWWEFSIKTLGHRLALSALPRPTERR